MSYGLYFNNVQYNVNYFINKTKIYINNIK